MTQRITCLLAVIGLAGCAGNPPRPWTEVLPAHIDGGWERGPITELPLDQAPPVLRSLGVSAAVRSTYRGPSEMEVTAYRMARGTAFEAVQKTRVEEGSTLFFHDDYFVVVRSGAGRDALLRFAGALDKALK